MGLCATTYLRLPIHPVTWNERWRMGKADVAFGEEGGYDVRSERARRAASCDATATLQRPPLGLARRLEASARLAPRPFHGDQHVHRGHACVAAAQGASVVHAAALGGAQLCRCCEFADARGAHPVIVCTAQRVVRTHAFRGCKSLKAHGARVHHILRSHSCTIHAHAHDVITVRLSTKKNRH